MRRRGFEDKNIATAINWTINRVHEVAGVKIRTIGARKAKQHVDAKDGEVINGRADRPLKGGLGHLKGKTIDEEVYQNIDRHYVGWPTTFLIRQLVMRIDDETLDLGDGRVALALAELRDKLAAMILEATA